MFVQSIWCGEMVLRISKMKIFWLKIRGVQCCLTCKYFHYNSIEAYCDVKEPLYLEERLSWKLNKPFLRSFGREGVGSACRQWEG